MGNGQRIEYNRVGKLKKAMKEEIRFNQYVQNYNPQDPLIRLKLIHTWKVVQAADGIAESLQLSESQKRLVHLAALFHDIGRFEQVRRFHTFVDAKSVDHAKLGASILEQEDFLLDLTAEERSQVIEAVRVHSLFAIPIDHTGFQKTLDQILRDADKIDIFRVGVEEKPDATASGRTLDHLEDERISPAVYKAICDRRSVLRNERASVLDFWIAFLGFVFDLNFQHSFQLVLEQGYWKMPVSAMLEEGKITDLSTQKQLEDILQKTQEALEKGAGKTAD